MTNKDSKHLQNQAKIHFKNEQNIDNYQKKLVQNEKLVQTLGQKIACKYLIIKDWTKWTNWTNVFPYIGIFLFLTKIRNVTGL